MLICDDSDDHHGKGVVVGLTSGQVRFWLKVEDLDLDDEDTHVAIGPNSVVAELRCMRAD